MKDRETEGGGRREGGTREGMKSRGRGGEKDEEKNYM